jgi:hypothetical protein
VIPELLHPEVAEFILLHENTDVNEFLLKYKSFHQIPASILADQINGRQKAKHKLPLYYSNTQIIYPPTVNLEQSSSERTAKFKLSFIQELFKTKVKEGVDLTGGFGVDALFLSKAFHQYHFVEPNPKLISIARHNHQSLDAKNIAYDNLFAEEFLKTIPGKFDLVYIDPSRRTSANKKVFSLTECEPDVLALKTLINEKSEYLLIKTSPLLDLQLAINQLSDVQKIVVLAVDNECKEVLFLCGKHASSDPHIQSVNISARNTEVFISSLWEEKMAVTEFGPPQKYLYEPNAAILKAGAFKTVADRFKIKKLHVNTHLYTSENLIDNFPGRIFQIEAVVKPDPKTLKPYFPEGKANITTRNYPLSPNDLKKKTKLNDGGEKYLIGFTTGNEKALVVAQRLK